MSDFFPVSPADKSFSLRIRCKASSRQPWQGANKVGGQGLALTGVPAHRASRTAQDDSNVLSGTSGQSLAATLDRPDPVQHHWHDRQAWPGRISETLTLDADVCDVRLLTPSRKRCSANATNSPSFSSSLLPTALRSPVRQSAKHPGPFAHK